MSSNLTFSGSVAKKFQASAITPLLAIVGLLLGVFGVLITPQEEEPQISVTFANVFIPFPGATAREVEQVVATPAEQVLSEVEGIKHVYSLSRPGMAVLTVQYEVGEDRANAILRLYNAIFSNQDFLPRNVGVGQPLVKPKGIDDVPIVTFTLWSEQPEWTGHRLTQVAHTLEAELKQVPGTRNVYTVGGTRRVVHVVLDPVKLAGHGLTTDDLAKAMQAMNSASHAGSVVRDNLSIPLQAGWFLESADDVAELVVGMNQGQPIYLREVAEIKLEADHPSQYAWFGTGPAASMENLPPVQDAPAVTLAVAKKPGSNASRIAQSVIERMEHLQGFVIPEGVRYTVTRDYGATAKAKADKLIGKLLFATFFVVILVLLTMGWREAAIVGAAVILTLALTLFANWAWGFTINRVSLFALIFSIGILVDDAIVVVENIHRHMHLTRLPLLKIIPIAVDEVGGPTILATFTVIAALLPMAFVTGLMGPYMSPIPINASTGMVISLVVAFVVTPWLCFKGLAKVHEKNLSHASHDGPAGEEVSARMLAFFHAAYAPFILSKRRGVNKLALILALLALIAGSLGLVVSKDVILKMLPFDNKSEFQVVVDMPENTPAEETSRVMKALASHLATVPEVTHFQAYVGVASPTGFNGLVRQYYLRADPNMGDIQVNLVDKHHRQRKSHEIAAAVRQPLQEIGRRHRANIKIVEVPPGPPVQSPLVVEVYGPDVPGQMRLAQKIRAVFEETPDIVDVDTSVEESASRYILRVDRNRAALLGVSQLAVSQALSDAVLGQDVTFIHTNDAKYPIPVHMELHDRDKAELQTLLHLKVRNQANGLVSLSEFVHLEERPIENAIYHKDLVPVVYVTGDMAGKLDSPLYGMMELYDKLATLSTDSGQPVQQWLISQPEGRSRYALKWDGEWQITYETFRDMGIAYGVGLLMIYLLVVGQFRSYVVPLVIMSPIPLTIVGVMPGHAIMGAQFTATSMIGMIALAGIIVRNSILLVDFINEETNKGRPFHEAVILAGAVRFKSIALTGLAAMLGALFILDDPIFSGLAIALIFGIFISTILTLGVIPIFYHAVMAHRPVVPEANPAEE